MVHKSFQRHKEQDGRRGGAGDMIIQRRQIHSHVWHLSLHGDNKTAKDFDVFDLCSVGPGQSQAS